MILFSIFVMEFLKTRIPIVDDMDTARVPQTFFDIRFVT